MSPVRRSGDRVGEGELTVGVAGDLPRPVMHQAVMVCAQKNEVVSIGVPTVNPVLDVMDLPVSMGRVATRESAVDVTMTNGLV